MNADEEVRSEAMRRSFSDWKGLQGLSAQFLVDMIMWVTFSYNVRGPGNNDDECALRNAILFEAERREWPADWWEDCSVIPEIRDSYLAKRTEMR